MKLLITKENHRFIVKEGSDMHTNYGMIKAADITNAKNGDTIKSNKGTEFFVMDAEFIDMYARIKRMPQIIPRKDIGLIITEIGLNKDTIVLETGSGSGALGCFLAKICKKVYSYELREDFYNVVKANIEMLGIKNMVLKNKDARLGFSEKNVDAILLDLPAPWEVMESVNKTLKVGGFLVNYSPTIPQVMDFVSNLGDRYSIIKTSEIIEREWEIIERKVRPLSQQIGHSGFLTFTRKIR
jgi:tRNA (adenine57-N1/adenine58-N1)-methyltransferase